MTGGNIFIASQRYSLYQVSITSVGIGTHCIRCQSLSWPKMRYKRISRPKLCCKRVFAASGGWWGVVKTASRILEKTDCMLKYSTRFWGCCSFSISGKGYGKQMKECCYGCVTQQKQCKNAGFVKKPWGGPQGFRQTCAETDVICIFGFAGHACVCGGAPNSAKTL